MKQRALFALPLAVPLFLGCAASGHPGHVPAPPLVPQEETPVLATDVVTEPSNDADVLDLLEYSFDLARDGASAELLRLLLPQFPIDVRNARGDTLLVLAAYYGRLETVALLLDRGASVDLPSDAGMTALMGAAFRGDEALVVRLLEAGADPLLVSHAGQTALGFAQTFGNSGAAKLLLAAIARG